MAEAFNYKSPLFPTSLDFVAFLIIAVGGLYFGLKESSSIVEGAGVIAAAQALNSFMLTAAQNRLRRESEYAYNYGYAKYESLSVICGGGLLLIGAGISVNDLISGLIASPPWKVNLWPLGIYTVFALFMSLSAYLFLRSSAERRNKDSIILRESELVRNDVYLRAFAAIAILAAYGLNRNGDVFSSAIVDKLCGAIMLIIALIGPLKAFKGAMDQLLDHTLPEEIQFEIIAAVADNIDKICEFKSIHTRRAGKGLFIEIDVVLPWNYTLEKAFELERELAAPIVEKYPDSIVRVYVVPCERDCPGGGENDCPPVKKKAPEEPSGRKTK